MADIKQIFWTNVDWHRKNKKMSWPDLVGGNTARAKNKTANVTIDKIQEIAKKLDVTDYAILFENIE